MIYHNPEIKSSYKENDIGRTLYDIVLALKPKRIIEFGVLHGYSTVAMAMALHELGAGKIFAYDLWEKYPYKHGYRSEVYKTLVSFKLDGFVQLDECDFYNWVPEPFDMMHVDISNDGRTIKHISRILQIKPEARIFFEGGTTERDQVEWVRKYGKQPITLSNHPYRVINPAFPGLSMATYYDPIYNP